MEGVGWRVEAREESVSLDLEGGGCHAPRYGGWRVSTTLHDVESDSLHVVAYILTPSIFSHSDAM